MQGVGVLVPSDNYIVHGDPQKRGKLAINFCRHRWQPVTDFRDELCIFVTGNKAEYRYQSAVIYLFVFLTAS